MRRARHLWWILLLALLAAGERWALPAWRAQRATTGEAQWISAPLPLPAEEIDWNQPAPLEESGFFAVRDFTLQGGVDRAVLRVMGEEAFWVTLNGQAVAAGEFHPGAPLVAVEVSGYLRAGLNRLLVELRSARPTGGLLLSLELEGDPGLERLVSDGSWRTVRDYQDDLAVPGAEVTDAVAARAWGLPPTGRWGRPEGEKPQPALVDLLLPGTPVPARRGRVGDPAGPWFRLPARPERADPLGNWVTFDFGRVQTGYLSFLFRDRGPVRGLVYLAMSPPDPRAERPTAMLLKLPGLATMTQAVPRRFRYVTLISTSRVSGAKVHAVDPERAGDLLDPGPRPVAALGLPMPLRTAVEDEVWRQVERLASSRARKGR